MTYQRGTVGCYDQWAQEVGDESYKFESFLRFFKQSVDFTPPNNALRAPNASLGYNANAFLSGASPLKVSVPIYANPFSSIARSAMSKLGFSTAVDFVSGTLSGVQYNMNTIDSDRQTRSSSQSSFLKMSKYHTQLRIYNGTLAKRIIFNGTRARGVSVTTKGMHYILHASTEVVLSAGAVNHLEMVDDNLDTDSTTVPVSSNAHGIGRRSSSYPPKAQHSRCR